MQAPVLIEVVRWPPAFNASLISSRLRAKPTSSSLRDLAKINPTASPDSSSSGPPELPWATSAVSW